MSSGYRIDDNPEAYRMDEERPNDKEKETRSPDGVAPSITPEKSEHVEQSIALNAPTDSQETSAEDLNKKQEPAKKTLDSNTRQEAADQPEATTLPQNQIAQSPLRPDAPQEEAKAASTSMAPPKASDTENPVVSPTRDEDSKTSEPVPPVINVAPTPIHDSEGSDTESRNSKNETHRRRKLYVELTYAAIVTALLFVISEIFVETDAGQHARTATYAFLQWLSPQGWTTDLPITVLNIENLASGYETPVNRERLLEIVHALSEVHAAAIGIDIDFSPTANGFTASRDDPRFFDACIDIAQTTPLYLGVFRTRGLSSEAWLGLPRYQSLAADLRGPPHDPEKLIYMWEGNAHLPSLGFALAHDYMRSRGQNLPVPSHWVRPFIEYDEDETSALGEKEVGLRLVNYGQALRMKLESVRATHFESIMDTYQSFEGKIVIIGDSPSGGYRLIEDSFRTPNGDRIPGVLFHASAAYTYALHPLWELKHWTRNALDLVLAVPFFLLVLVKYSLGSNTQKESDVSEHWVSVELGLLLLCELLTLILGVTLLFELNVMWLEFLVAMIGLGLHPYLARKLEKGKRAPTSRPDSSSPSA
jgi:CHASE2 domain-containing sensor protein